MRIPPLVVACLLLANTTLFAQGLEYRVRTHMTVPGMSGGAPIPESTMFVEGLKIRVDNAGQGMSMSIILDGATQRMYYLDHNARTYREEKPLDKMGPGAAASDTAAMRALGMIPEIIATPDTRTILGYTTRRFITIVRTPVPAEPGTVMVSIQESWIATDSRLKEAFRSSMEMAERMLGPVARDLKSLTPPGADGVPLETNILMLKRSPGDKVDAVALLANPNPQGLMGRTRMEALSVKVLDLPDNLFAVPAGYRKAN